MLGFSKFSLNLGQAFQDVFASFAFLSILISLIFSSIFFLCFCRKHFVLFCPSERFSVVPADGKQGRKISSHFERNLSLFKTDFKKKHFYS